MAAPSLLVVAVVVVALEVSALSTAEGLALVFLER
jgi:hypothetical protein